MHPEDFITECERCWRPALLAEPSDTVALGGDVPRRIAPSSTAGAFLRQCRLAFDSMPFEVRCSAAHASGTRLQLHSILQWCRRRSLCSRQNANGRAAVQCPLNTSASALRNACHAASPLAR